MDRKNITMPAVKDKVPQVLIDYLWEILGFMQDRSKKRISLKPNHLGYQDVQDIHCESQQLSWQEEHRLFGITPVACELEVIYHKDGFRMSLVKETADLCIQSA